jgi:hypothetical protein
VVVKQTREERVARREGPQTIVEVERRRRRRVEEEEGKKIVLEKPSQHDCFLEAAGTMVALMRALDHLTEQEH